jgi:DNA-binding transcriptional ArsR family regulator
MDSKIVVARLAALAQESRLAIFRELIQAGKDGLNAGKISELTQTAPNSVSFHMKELVHAGLVTSRQEGRYVIYTAQFDAMTALIAYLTENCCGGETCGLDCGC